MTQMQHFDGTDHITMYHEPERTSIAAILGLVLGCIGCCGGITAILGIFLSIFGIVGISRSRGRIGGMGFAIAGLLVSLLTLALWGAVVGGAIYAAEKADAVVVQPLFKALGDLESDNFDGARAVWGSPAADATDEELMAFRDGYQAMLGSVVSTPDGLVEWILDASELGDPVAQFAESGNLIPVPMEFDRGKGLVLIFFVQNQGNGGVPIPMQIVIFDANGNSVSLPAGIVESVTSDSDVDPKLPDVDVEDFSGDSAGDSADKP